MITANPLQRALYLTGPTASGKTVVGVGLARRLDAEVIALDSMTLYRGLDVGTAKPSLVERGGIPHHLLDLLDPWEAATVAAYRDWAIEAAAAIESRGRRVLFVGGTALYLKALLRGLFDGPPADLALRHELQELAERRGDRFLHERLEVLDPPAAARLHPNDRRRLIRALEVIERTGRPLSAQQTQHDQPAPGVWVIALTRTREDLHTRINRRVLQMFESGFVDEVRRLRDAERPPGPGPLQGVGYREVIDHLEGRVSLPETIARVQARTRQFAKRQMTWFRGLEEVRREPVAEDECSETTAARLFAMFLHPGI